MVSDAIHACKQDFSGTIDMDECMEILFRRFGKEMLESKVALLCNFFYHPSPNRTSKRIGGYLSGSKACLR